MMPESFQNVRWVSQTSGRPFLYAVLTIPVVVAVVLAYSWVLMLILPKVPEWTFYGLLLIFLLWVFWLCLILTDPDPSRPAKVQAAAAGLGLSFASRPASGETALPPEFSLARWSAQWFLPRRRGPRNLLRGQVAGRTVLVFDIAYPGYQLARFETTAVYFPDPVPGLPDWGADGSKYVEANRPPEPFALLLAAHSVWTVECRACRLLIYRPFYLCHPESYSEFLAAAGQVYADIASAATEKT